MVEAVRNCVRFVGIALAEALRMASLYPAQAIGVDHSPGATCAGLHCQRNAARPCNGSYLPGHRSRTGLFAVTMGHQASGIGRVK